MNLNSKFLAGIAVAIIATTGCSGGEDLKTLSSSEIEKLLKGNTIEGVVVAQWRPFKQYFGADGNTVQVIDRKLSGKWYVDGNNQLCFRWNIAKAPGKMAKETGSRGSSNASDKTSKGQCFNIKQDSQGKHLVYHESQGHTASLKSIVPGNPGKL